MKSLDLSVLSRGDHRGELVESLSTTRVDLAHVGREASSIAILLSEAADVQRMARLITGVHDLSWITGDGAGAGLYVRNGEREYLVYDWYARVPPEMTARRHQFVLDNSNAAEERSNLTVIYLSSYDDKGNYLRVAPNALLFSSELVLQLGNVNLETMSQRAKVVRCRQIPANHDLLLDIEPVMTAAGQ